MKLETIKLKLGSLAGFDERFLDTIYIDKFKYRKILKAIPEFYSAYLKKTAEYNTFFDFFETFHCYLIGLGVKVRVCKEYFDELSSKMNSRVRDEAVKTAEKDEK